MATIRNERLKLLGLDPADPASGRIFMEWSARLFGAQIVVVVCVDKALPSSCNLEIGLFAQTVCLAAQGCGVDSFIAGMLVSQPDILRRELEIPEDLNIVIGIGLGYPSPDSIINTYRSPRRPIHEVVRYKS
jgi:nitroreductase